jgi:hypothetical protein
VTTPACNYFSDWQLDAGEGTSYPVIIVLSETPNDNLPVSEDESDSLNMFKLSTINESV